MLKTTDQQHTAPDEYGAERLVPVEETQPAQSVAAEEVLELEHLENIQALIDEFTIEAERLKRKRRLRLGVMMGSNLALFGMSLFLLRNVLFHHAVSVNWWYVGISLTLQALIPFASMGPFMA